MASPAPNLTTRLQTEAQAWCKRARQAQAPWHELSLKARLQIVRRARHSLARDGLLLGQMTAEARGCPPAEALASEVLPLADACRFLERQAARILQSRRVGRWGRPFWLGGLTSRVERDPHGIVLILGASNYPLFLAGVQLIQALVAGNAVLLKPGLRGTQPLAAWIRILTEAGLPADLVQLLPEDPAAGQAAMDAGVDYVILTGRATSGVAVLHQAAERLTPAAMELSGCDAVVVREDANLEMTVRALTFGLRLNQGATCIAPRRILVHRKVATELEGRLERAVKALAPATLSAAAAGEVFPLVQQALDHGAHLIAGRLLPGGAVEGPLVVAGAAPNAPLLQADLFAPILSLVTVADDAEAVTRANASPYALGAAIFSADQRAAQALSRHLQVGVVQINDLIAPTADPRLPFGGRRRSGFGVTRGVEGLLELTVLRVVTSRAGSWRPHYDPLAADDLALFSGLLGMAHAESWRARGQSILKVLRNLSARVRQSRNPAAPKPPD